MIPNNRLGRAGAAGLMFLALALIGGCAKDKAVIQQANQFDTGLKPAEIKEPDLDHYLQSIGQRIIEAAKESDRARVGPKSHFDSKQDESWMFTNRIQFHLVNSKTLNAFTTGGEHVYVYNELFQQCSTEDELAAVMSHEFGHIYARHVAKGMNRQYGVLAAAALVGAGGYAVGGKEHGSEYAQTGAGLGMAAGQFANMGFTRGDEAEADKLGFHFYVLAGWDPQKFADFFEHMIKAGYDKTPAIQSDHPTLASRVEATKKELAKLPRGVEKYRRPNIATPEEFQRYKQLALKSGQNLPDDKKVLQAQNLLQALPRSCWVPYEPEDQKQAQEALLAKARETEQQRQAGSNKRRSE